MRSLLTESRLRSTSLQLRENGNIAHLLGVLLYMNVLLRMKSARLVFCRALLIATTALSVPVIVAQAPAPHVSLSPCSSNTARISSKELMDLLVTRKPVQPPMHERSRLHGTVTVRVCVTERGRVVSAAIIDGHPMAHGAVLDSVHHWIFSPYRIGGRPKPVVADLEVAYDFRSPPHSGSICVRIDDVGGAPGFWSGIAAATQSLAATVISSSAPEYEVGDHLAFSLYVVSGDSFADPTVPQLNPRIIHKGANLTLQTSDKCREAGHTEWIFACVETGCAPHALEK